MAIVTTKNIQIINTETQEQITTIVRTQRRQKENTATTLVGTLLTSTLWVTNLLCLLPLSRIVLTLSTSGFLLSIVTCAVGIVRAAMISRSRI